MTVPFALDRTALARVLAIASGKGGVGKTSLADHIAAMVAASGRRVLLFDLDPQNNSKDDLGYEGSDGGRSVVAAVMLGVQMTIIRDVRPGLDVIAGGPELHKLADYLRAQRARENDDNRGSTMAHFASVIAAQTGGYDLVIIDCPPANTDVLIDAALATARYLLVPTHPDKSSRDGLVEMAGRVRHARSGNPALALLGVVLFGIGSRSTLIRDLARDWIEGALGGAAPVFETSIRHAQGAAVDCRELGRLAFEIDPYDGEGDAGGDEGAEGGPARRRVVSATGALGGDYRRLGTEVLRRLVEMEAAA